MFPRRRSERMRQESRKRQANARRKLLLVDVAGVPQLLTCGEQTVRAKNPAQVAGFISEWCPASNWNPVQLQIENRVRLASEFAKIGECFASRQF